MGKKSKTDRRDEIHASITSTSFEPKLGRYVMEIIRTKWNALNLEAQINIANQCGLGTSKGTKTERNFRRFAIAVALLDFLPTPPPNPKTTVKNLPAAEIAGYVRRCLARPPFGVASPETVRLLHKNATLCWNLATGGRSSTRIQHLATQHVIRPSDTPDTPVVTPLQPPKYFSEKQRVSSTFKGIWDATPSGNHRPAGIYPMPATPGEPFGGHTSPKRPDPIVTNYLHAYYLPWSPGWAVKYNIPANARDKAFFLTAALSGCSVFVRGPATNPTVYHCGLYPDYWRAAVASKLYHTGTSLAAQTYNDAIRNAIQSKNAHDLFKLVVEQEGNTDACIRSSDYAKGSTTCRACGNQKSTPQLERIHRLIKALFPTQILTGAAGECSGFGAVFGIKKNGTWKFYLQGGFNLQIKSPDGLHKWLISQPTHLLRFYPTNSTKEIPLRVTHMNFLDERITDLGLDVPRR